MSLDDQLGTAISYSSGTKQIKQEGDRREGLWGWGWIGSPLMREKKQRTQKAHDYAHKKIVKAMQGTLAITTVGLTAALVDYHFYDGGLV